MEPSDIHITDLQRVFFGDVPGSFYIEIIIRTVIVYLILITSMRLMGKRMGAQISRNELAALVSLAAAIGVPLQSPERGLLIAIVIAIVIILIDRSIAMLIFKYAKFEKISQGNLGLLVADGVLNIKTMNQVRVTKNHLYAKLRNQKIRHLGEIKRVYMESGGDFTIIKAKETRPGLPIIPDWDRDYMDRQQKGDTLVCSYCGKLQERNGQQCSNCGHQEWKERIK